jgi:hypothetical protein
MNQFIDSLKKRQAQLEKEQADLQRTINEAHARLNAVTGALNGVHALLHLEGVVPDNGAAPGSMVVQPSGALTLNGRAPQLYDVVISALQDRKPHTTLEIVEVAQKQGVKFEGKDPMKTVSMTLLGISRGKKYKHHGNGSYQQIAD